MRTALSFGVAAVLGLAACGDTTIFDPMERQPKYKPFAQNPFYADGRAMRAPPQGTVPRERITQNPELTTGRKLSGETVRDLPLAVDRRLVELGRKKFDIHCSVCHGILGDGRGRVAEKMSLRLPPSLHQLKDPSPGHVFVVISQGFGVMPSYAVELTIQDRWAVVAYVQALQVSQAATIAEAPPDVRRKLAEEKPQ